jgi:large subunit ribosomal protein L5
MTRLKELYSKKLIQELKKHFGYKNIMAVPKLEKIVINIGLGEAIKNIKLLDQAVIELSQITGQKPTVTKARKAIASFKLRKGLPIGCMVTLRKDRMYEFYDRFVNITLPRVKDFQGVKISGFDGNGNYTMGLKDQIVFTEIDYDKIQKITGMNITFVTTAKTNDEAKELLRLLGMPFAKQ